MISKSFISEAVSSFTLSFKFLKASKISKPAIFCCLFFSQLILPLPSNKTVKSKFQTNSFSLSHGTLCSQISGSFISQASIFANHSAKLGQ
jgi:hypothetical protein